MTTKVTSRVLENTAVTPGTYGNATQTSTITVDAQGRITSASNTSIFPSGGIIMWSGTIVPSGWFLCNGTNGTPDLRGRFIVGSNGVLGQYGLGATGGSADAIVVSHTHTASVSDPGHQHLFGGDDQIAGQGGYLSQSGFSYDANSTTSGGALNYFTKRTDNTNNPQTTGISVSNSTTGSSGTNANLPPYYALAFIMKS